MTADQRSVTVFAERYRVESGNNTPDRCRRCMPWLTGDRITRRITRRLTRRLTRRVTRRPTGLFR